MKPTARSSITSTLVLGLVVLPAVLAHGGGGEQHDSHGAHDAAADAHQDVNYPPTYFAHPDHAAVLYAHVALMTLAWVLVLPVAVMLSLVRSRYTLPCQLAFAAVNAFGILLGMVYNAETPDLYPNNAHHKIGWIVTAVVSAQLIVSILSYVAGVFGSRHSKGQAFVPVSSQAAGEHHIHGSPGHPSHQYFGEYRLSDDSGHGTGPNTESSRSNSISVSDEDEDGPPMLSRHKEYHDGGDLEAMPLAGPERQMSAIAVGVVKVVTSRFWKYLDIMCQVVDRIILPFGFIAFTSGIATTARFFEGHAIFGGLAHWSKGGVFFWLGLFNLGRWSGSFGELGWAWNQRPEQRRLKWRPTAEFVESALIFFYGATNIFLEHLGNWGRGWTAQDFEHISITVLFIGGGLCGMLIESTYIRSLLNTTVTESVREKSYAAEEPGNEEREELRPPTSYGFSLNPIPALVIMLLGIMMSSHQQESMISSMIHKQWGNLLVGASFARGLTYVLLYLRPPQSVLPSRPPTELLASFGLIAGGIIFMASASDVVEGMIHYKMDEMFMYTVTMGLVGLVMAWEVIVLATKGLALHRERRATPHRYN